MFAIVRRRDDDREFALRVALIDFITRHTDVDGVDYFTVWIDNDHFDIDFMSGTQIYNPLGQMEPTQDIMEEAQDDGDE